MRRIELNVMDIKQIDKTSKRYIKQSLWIVAAITFATSIAISVNWLNVSLTKALAIIALYTVIINLTYGYTWKHIAKSAPTAIGRFYLAASSARLITSAIVIISFCLINQNDREGIRSFILLFIAYYLVMLIFDSIFFAHIEKNNNLKTEK